MTRSSQHPIHLAGYQVAGVVCSMNFSNLLSPKATRLIGIKWEDTKGG